MTRFALCWVIAWLGVSAVMVAYHERGGNRC